MSNMLSCIIKSFPPWRLFVASTVLGFLTWFNYGWQSSCVNIPEQQFLNLFNNSFNSHYGYYLSESGLESLWAFALNISYASSIIGSLLCMKLIPYTGLRHGISFWGGLGTVVGLILMSLLMVTNSFELFIVGHTIVGVAKMYSTTLLFILLAEASPNYARGFVAMWVNVLALFSQVLGAVVSLPSIWGEENKLWLLLGLPIIPVAIQMLIYQFFPDSPKRLYIHMKDKEGAANSVKFYHGNETDIISIFNEYEAEAMLEMESMSLANVISSKSLRLPLLLSLAVTFGSTWGGTVPATSFSTHIFEKAGVSEGNSNTGSIVVAFIGIPAALVSMFLIDSVGRRFFVLSGLIFACVCLLGLIILPNIHGKVPAILEIVCLVVLIFVMNWGPLNISGFLPAELLPFAARAVGFGLKGIVFSVCSMASSQMYNGLNETIGSYVFIIFLVPLVFVTIFIYFKLPETMNTSSMEISSMIGGFNKVIIPPDNEIGFERY